MTIERWQVGRLDRDMKNPGRLLARWAERPGSYKNRELGLRCTLLYAAPILPVPARQATAGDRQLPGKGCLCLG